MKIAASTRFARTLLAVTTAFVAACSGAPAVSHTGATPAPPQARAFAGEVAAEVERQAGAIADRAAEADAIAAEAEARAAEAEARAAADAAEEVETAVEMVARRMRANEVTTAHGLEATRILKSTYHLPMGSEIPYELDGAPFMAKIELHWHEPHVHPLPWGWHRGISLYVLEPAS